MLSAEQNNLITRIGPGTPAGNLMRHYWQPAALVDELSGARPVKPVRLLGENLVMFRDNKGGYGLIDRMCPHRGTDLAYGRLEDGGLRCSFHGWLFDRAGKCLETPAEPEGSNLCANIRQKAYPVVEKNGILFAYMGPGEPPEFPHFDCFIAPDSHTFAFKGMIECNWLQSLEVGIDPAHTSFLHRFFHDEDPKDYYGKLFRDVSADSDMPMTKIMRDFPRPKIEVEQTDYGMRIATLRQISDKNTHIRITNLMFPNAFIIPMNREKMMAEVAPGITVPLKPFWGSIGVAPPAEKGKVNSNPPHQHAGNMDNKELVAGTTLYVPVWTKGALLELGDGHAAQGDGEVDQTAIETNLKGRIQVIVRKDLKFDWPRIETPTHWITMGADTSLVVATKTAIGNMVKLLQEHKGITQTQAYQAASMAADLRITELVDGNLGVHMMIAKDYLKPGR